MPRAHEAERGDNPHHSERRRETLQRTRAERGVCTHSRRSKRAGSRGRRLLARYDGGRAYTTLHRRGKVEDGRDESLREGQRNVQERGLRDGQQGKERKIGIGKTSVRDHTRKSIFQNSAKVTRVKQTIKHNFGVVSCSTKAIGDLTIKRAFVAWYNSVLDDKAAFFDTFIKTIERVVKKSKDKNKFQ